MNQDTGSKTQDFRLQEKRKYEAKTLDSRQKPAGMTNGGILPGAESRQFRRRFTGYYGDQGCFLKHCVQMFGIASLRSQ